MMLDAETVLVPVTHPFGISAGQSLLFARRQDLYLNFVSKRNFVPDAAFVARRPNGATREIAMKKGFLISVSVFALVASAGVSAAQEKGAPSGSGQAPAAQQSPAGPQPSQQPAQEDLRGNRAQGAPNQDNQTQRNSASNPGKTKPKIVSNPSNRRRIVNSQISVSRRRTRLAHSAKTLLLAKALPVLRAPHLPANSARKFPLRSDRPMCGLLRT